MNSASIGTNNTLMSCEGCADKNVTAADSDAGAKEIANTHRAWQWDKLCAGGGRKIEANDRPSITIRSRTAECGFVTENCDTVTAFRIAFESSARRYNIPIGTGSRKHINSAIVDIGVIFPPGTNDGIVEVNRHRITELSSGLTESACIHDLFQ